MADMKRIRCTWQGGGVIGPSVSTFYFDDAHTGFQADLITFWDSVKTRLPSIVSVTVQGSGDVIESSTGALTGIWSEGSDTNVPGTGTAQCPQGVGGRIVWSTLGTTNGRRVRGTTFMIPLDASMYDTLGTLSASRSDFVSAGNALLAASTNQLLIWTRPRPGTAGGINSVVSCDMPDKISTLRSRRV
jgi:hypothetical protein